MGSDYLDQLVSYISMDQIPVALGGTYTAFQWSWPYDSSSLCTSMHIQEYNSYRDQLFQDCDEDV